MNRRRFCLRAFPGSWRRRYGDELLALLAEDDRRPGSADLDLLRAGLRERVHRARPLTAARGAGLAGAVCAIVALAPGAIGPATSTPRARPTVLAAVTVFITTPPRLRLLRPVAVRGRMRVRTIVVAPVPARLLRARAAPGPAAVIVRART